MGRGLKGVRRAAKGCEVMGRGREGSVRGRHERKVKGGRAGRRGEGVDGLQSDGMQAGGEWMGCEVMGRALEGVGRAAEWRKGGTKCKEGEERGGICRVAAK